MIAGLRPTTEVGANAARPNPETTLEAALVAILEHMLAEIRASKTTKRTNATAWVS
jgi:hypothetical protein